MHRVTLTVNGSAITAAVEPRTHLADFLRDTCLLTGTHLGCEHGVCGACTILLDAAPARSCIAFAAASEGCDIRTIEGLEDDPITQRLREAFSAEHALQCGYCTPGMLVTARDIVIRLPDADEARIRLELAGNLCRCTGYAGIVRAIGRVLRQTPSVTEASPASAGPARTAMPVGAISQPAPGVAPGPSFTLTLRIGRPCTEVWTALHDPTLLAGCVPGARLVAVNGEAIEGEIQANLGPIAALFTGTGRLILDEATQRATLTGQGQDKRSHTRLSGTAIIAPQPAEDGTTHVTLTVNYALRGPLAQLARGPVVQAFAAEIAGAVAHNLERRLLGQRSDAAETLSAFGLVRRIVWQYLRRWLPRG